MRELARTNPR